MYHHDDIGCVYRSIRHVQQNVHTFGFCGGIAYQNVYISRFRFHILYTILLAVLFLIQPTPVNKDDVLSLSE